MRELGAGSGDEAVIPARINTAVREPAGVDRKSAAANHSEMFFEDERKQDNRSDINGRGEFAENSIIHRSGGHTRDQTEAAPDDLHDEQRYA